MLLSGILPPVTTPFYRDGRGLLQKAGAQRRALFAEPGSGHHGAWIRGRAADVERRREAKRAEVRHRKRSSGKGDDRRNRRRVSHRDPAPDRARGRSGYDVAMVRTPHYYKQQMQPLNMLSFYRFVADRSPLPVVIYNAPHTTGYDIPVEVVLELAEHPNVIGIKESSASPEKLRSIVGGRATSTARATVTERFEPVTGRMLKGAAPAHRGCIGSGRSSWRHQPTRIPSRRRPPCRSLAN